MFIFKTELEIEGLLHSLKINRFFHKYMGIDERAKLLSYGISWSNTGKYTSIPYYTA